MIKFATKGHPESFTEIGGYGWEDTICKLSLRENDDGSVTLRGYFGEGNGFDDIFTILPDGTCMLEELTSFSVVRALSLDKHNRIKLLDDPTMEQRNTIKQLDKLGAFRGVDEVDYE